MEIQTKIRQIGHSMGIVTAIPKDFVKAEPIKSGGKVRKSFFSALKGVGKFAKEDELNAHD